MEKFNCDKCGREFDNKKSLRQHKNDKHWVAVHHTPRKQFPLKYVALGVISLVAIGTGFFAYSNTTGNFIETLGEEIPIEGRTHVAEGSDIIYKNSNPPTSGNHWPQPAQWGFYLSPLPDEQLVHNLEHGGIWISYNDIDEETKSKLGVIASKYPLAVISAPRPENDDKIAVASWGKLLKLDSLDEELIEKFIKSNINKAPEPLASLGQPSIKLGGAFPDFEVTEVDGRKITKESLQGKPAIIWFTTSWCTPCQIGAREVSRLDNELGGNAFDVLVIFVDPREKNSDLINWRTKFANEDWMVAFDNEITQLAARTDIRFLDSKFILDKNGVVRDIDFKTADEKYLNTIKKMMEEG